MYGALNFVNLCAKLCVLCVNLHAFSVMWLYGRYVTSHICSYVTKKKSKLRDGNVSVILGKVCLPAAYLEDRVPAFQE